MNEATQSHTLVHTEPRHKPSLSNPEPAPLTALRACVPSPFSRVRLFVTLVCSPPGSSVCEILQTRVLECHALLLKHLSISLLLVLLHIYPLAGLQCCSIFQMDKPRQVEFRKVTCLSLQPDGELSYWEKLGPSLASITSFCGLLWDSLCQKGRENGGFPVFPESFHLLSKCS